ncbi:putative 3-oxoacyl-synthase [Aspergillus ibericus CBS 121593]|uniref:Putative 3-oxoacyl-synthase n=1 Tax=Aspergillus ibericus CBS 121593 TaxID=1448316 RepID=A0A395H7F7_9EURO|nr:putative 3-oxoacyl-synthase [Aspergillus ibericus CBS 121593]RAL03095.1 putative 3-oxoacyl-synthase [Aspergillus ibericus CBS 121593]
MTSDQLTDSQRRKLAHQLLIEHLSYQFAFPVQWINTQQALLQHDPPIQRIIEIGPARVLATMAQKTATTGPTARHDQANAINRQFLSSASNLKEIYYEYEEPAEPAQPAPAATPTTTPVTTPATTAAPAPATAPAPAAAASIPDTPLTAGDLVLALTAQKLKKPFDQVPRDKSIRDLSGGKSTLQNELIGDLEAELGHLPDNSETLALEALSTLPCSGQLGKPMTSLVARLISSKMPAGYTQQAIRQHLQTRWGLEVHRQTAVLCYATTLEPAARLADPAAATDFLDRVVQRYAQYFTLTLTPGSSTTPSGPAAIVDASALEAATREQKTALRKIHEVLGQLLDEPEAMAEPTVSTAELTAQLDHWTTEFGSQMQTGTAPLFDARKIRLYDSWWNWVRVDLLSLLQRLDREDVPSAELENELHMIFNRWTPACSQLVDFASTTRGHPIRETFNSEHRGVDPTFRYTQPSLAPKTTITDTGDIQYTEVPRVSAPTPTDHAFLLTRSTTTTTTHLPFCHIRRRHGPTWRYHAPWTNHFLDALTTATTTGLSFKDRTVLITGASPGSIGAEAIKGLLQGGAHVLVTTSRAISATADFYSTLYKRYGARGSKLILLPFNQASVQDCDALIDHIYTQGPASGGTYGGDIDAILPFAAMPQTGTIDSGLDERAELAHRLMLTNLLRLLGRIKYHKVQRRITSRPTTIILPLSPNHGTFGGDGLYSESKLGLETLLNRFDSERWAPYLAVCGTVIGWTRGTGLMSGNNILAEAVEAQGAMTFSAGEMAWNVLAVLGQGKLVAACEEQPVWVDLSGGLAGVEGLKEVLGRARREMQRASQIRQAIVAEREREREVLGVAEGPGPRGDGFRPRAGLRVGYPAVKEYETAIQGLPDLQGMMNLQKTVVVVGYSELGPWGSARTRWEMESTGAFSVEGLVEMAWMMGLIEHWAGEVQGQPYAGWVDRQTKAPVRDDEIGTRYGEYIRAHTGIRFIEPELLNGYDPDRKEFLHEVVVNEDLPVFTAARATAEAFQLRYGDKVVITPQGEDECAVRIKKGAHFLVPKAIPFSRKVAGLLPTGWDPARYGIPEDIVAQVDPITLYVLCCVCQAMLSTGIQDPFEIYQHMHVSEVANCIGTGVGGLVSMRGVYGDRYLDRPVQNDILQESYLNAMGAWTNMLLLGSSGPIKTPVGTCATAVESLDSGCESLLLGKAKLAIVGGTDDFQAEMSYEFANMKATANTLDELAKGRLPHDMSRPSTTSRSGFMESAGCGIQIITTADTALAMGLPIYGIIAYTQMAGDRIGRSVPAPGQGILTAARESPPARSSPLLSLPYRRAHLTTALSQIQRERTDLLTAAKHLPLDNTPHSLSEHLHRIETLTTQKLLTAQTLWSNPRLQDPTISPLRAALATWSLTIDDLTVATLHGTSTPANDLNEARVLNTQMSHLHRTPGNPLLTISQKHLTGHPKGAAGAWMLNGGLQVLSSGVVPGNRNADNIDEKFRGFEHLVYPSTAMKIGEDGMKAFMLTSFGFGQKGGVVVVVAARYLFAGLGKGVYEGWKGRVGERMRRGEQVFLNGFMGKNGEGWFRAKEVSAWGEKKEDETRVFLDPGARVAREGGEYVFSRGA